MPDYGHGLSFGTFITPNVSPSDGALQLARHSEELGFDLVSFQDHPYQLAFFDTWTLMTWVAAHTSRVQISANVHNLPLRPPAVLARAAASLDPLSGGRLALGLGAGGFWDAIVAMGGPRRTPGESVEALDEAIEIVRGIWDVDDRDRLRVDGEHYRVEGAKRGPRPAHDIPIWVGGYKPRMLRLIARRADGWLPSLFGLEPGDLARANEIIDETALEADRDPRAIRRMLNVGGDISASGTEPFHGPAERWVDDLLPLAVQDGISTFILATDDPAVMEAFALEVIPALRDAVTEARGLEGRAPNGVRSAAARAKRIAGIDYDGLPASLAAEAIEPGDPGYAAVRNTYNRGGAPGLVVTPRTVEQVADAIAFARHQPVPLGVRSGGHGVSGRSTNDGGVVIDMSHFAEITVLDEATRRVRVGPGARWMDVSAVLAPHGWALTSGDYGAVGVGGLATAGGFGWFAREHGLTIDHLRAVELVTASGELVRASEEEHPELFWAMRGAGANFGVATAFEFEAHPVPPHVGWAQLAFEASAAPGGVAGFLVHWAAAMVVTSRDVTSSLVLTPSVPGLPHIVRLLAVVDTADSGVVIERLRPFAGLAPIVGQQVQMAPYEEVVASLIEHAPHDEHGEPVSRSGLADTFGIQLATRTARLLEKRVSHFVQLRSLGGAVSDVESDATAYSGRSATVSIVAQGSEERALDAEWRQIEPLLSGSYLNFDSSLDPARLARAWSPQTLQRLRALKAECDPQNVFRDNFNVAAVRDAG